MGANTERNKRSSGLELLEVKKLAKNNQKHQRKGLSSVVGAVFMVLVMIGALNVILLAMRQQDSVTQTLIDKSSASLSRLNEQISIADARVTSSNKLNMTVINSGAAAAKLASIYIVNETASPKTQYRFDLNSLGVDGRQSKTNIGSTSPSLPFTVKSDTVYTVKVVTMAGNSAVVKLTPLKALPLKMAAYVIPPSITTGENVTILFAVTNNATDTNLAQTVSPQISASLSCVASPTCASTLKVAADTNVLIPKGTTYLFKSVYEIKGPVATIITFNASLTNAKPGNYVIEKGRIISISSANVANTFLFARLVQQPEMQVIFPNPFGGTGSGAQAVWGAIVSNPTEGTMHVRKLVITGFSPRANSNDKIICADTPTAIANMPATGTWSCPATNTAIWKMGASPVTILPHMSQAFWVKMGAPSTGGSNDIESLAVNYNVFTDWGQFTKTGYDMGLKGSAGNHPMVNAFSSKVIGSLSTANMVGVMNVTQAQQIKVNATIANFVSGANVDAGSRLVIDIPQDFSSVNVLSSTGFNAPCVPTPFSDGSTQIACSLTAALSGTAPNDARTIQFTAIAPAVDINKLYVLYLLADGTSEGNTFAIGPVGEMIMRVTTS